MSGWIKVDKELESDPRVLRMAKAIDRAFHLFTIDAELDPCNAVALPGVTLVCGGLARLWIYADSHIRNDNTLDLGAAEIDEWLGIPGFCVAMPGDWLVQLDERTVELPGFQEHNGVEARKRALTQKRVTQHRNKEQRTSVTGRNASALPDQTRPDQTKTRPERIGSTTAAARPANGSHPTEFAEFQQLYPKRAGGNPWPRALKAIHARLADGHTWQQILDGARRYAAFIRATGKERSEYVMQAATFCGPDKRFLEPWDAPPSKAQLRQDENVQAGIDWLKRASDAAA